MAFNIFNAGLDGMEAGQRAFDRSYALTDKGFKDAAARKAGTALASGDRQGAMAAMGGEGELDAVRQMQLDQGREDQQAYSNKRQQGLDAEAKKAELGKALQEAFQHVATLKTPQDRRAAMKHPVWQIAGIKPEMVDALPDSDFSDAATAQFGKTLEQYTLAPGSKRFDTTGKLVAEAPFAPEYRSVGPGDSLVELGGQGGALQGDPLQGVSALTSMGAQVTSGQRTPEHNREVGGVPNSRHLTGNARDLVPPPGMTMAQLEAEARRRVPGAKVLNEGDHVHIEWSGGQPGGARVVAQGAPKPQERWEDLPGGGQVNPATGEKKNVPNGNSDRKFIADTRKEFNNRPEVKEYRDVSTSYRQIYALANKPATAGSDIAMVFSYMKMLDPGSVVREGEFATAQNAAGVPDQVRNLWNRALQGTRLNDKQRKDFLNQAYSVYRTRQGRFNEIANEYRGYAQTAGENPDLIVTIPKGPPPKGAGSKSQKVKVNGQTVTVTQTGG